MNDGGRDGRCDKGSGSEGGLMLVVPELVKRHLFDDIWNKSVCCVWYEIKRLFSQKIWTSCQTCSGLDSVNVFDHFILWVGYWTHSLKNWKILLFHSKSFNPGCLTRIKVTAYSKDRLFFPPWTFVYSMFCLMIKLKTVKHFKQRITFWTQVRHWECESPAPWHFTFTSAFFIWADIF